MKNVNNLNECYGCRVCELKCPANCVTMIENKKGFLIPKVDENTCINCSVCIKHCQVFSEYKKNTIKQCYVLQSKNKNNLEKSASGSFFYTMAQKAYEAKINIFGCLFDSELNPVIKKATTCDDIENMCGSKYVESDVLKTYEEVENLLINGEAVIYTALPCQVAGLKKYLNREYDKLVTIDLICHGTPSRKLFRKYIQYLEKKYNSKVKNIIFRNKKNIEWGRYVEKVMFEDKEIIMPSNLDLYYSAFFSNNAFKDSCYSCAYAQDQKKSEITIGDAWGETLSNDDSKGLSCIIINNQKGSVFFENYKELFLFKNIDFESLAKNNKQLLRPSQKTNSNDFYKDIDQTDFVSFMNSNEIFIAKKTLKLIKFKIKYWINKFLK